MLTDKQVLKELEQLGLDATSYRVLSVLPMVMVAWADHEVQAEERSTILEVAKGHGLTEGSGAGVLERWLTERPTNETFRRGILLFVHLAHRDTGVGADVPTSALDFTVELCLLVAEAAGSLFGLTAGTSAKEKAAIAAIAEAMDDEAERIALAMKRVSGPRSISSSWVAMMDELDLDGDLPESF